MKAKKLSFRFAIILITLLLCVIALIGASFAWYTESENISNEISSGTVKVTLGGGETPLVQNSNAEPGASYVAKFSLTNSGDAAFTCTLNADLQADSSEDLARALTVYIVSLDSESQTVTKSSLDSAENLGTLYALTTASQSFSGDIIKGETKYYAAVIYFDSSAGNDLQEKSVTFSLTVTATQVTTPSS